MLAAVRGAVVLVLDEFERADGEVADGLLWLVERAPYVEAVVACRDVTRLESATAMARVESRLLRTDDLLFTEDEARELLRSVGADPDGAQPLLAATGGLPLLVRSVVVGLDGSRVPTAGPRRDETIRRIAREAVDELIAAATRRGVDRDTAMRLALADTATGELAGRLTGKPGEEQVAAIVREGLATVERSPHGHAIRMTQVVREALREEFVSRHPDEVASVSRVIAEWQLDSGDAFGAFATAMAVGDLAFASRVTRTHFFDLLGQHGRGVYRLLAPVSRLTLRRYPLLTLMLALIYNARGHRVRAIEHLALTTIGARAARRTSDPEERIVLLAVESASLRVAGRIAPALRAARAFQSAVDEIPVENFERLSNVAPTLFAHVGVTLLYAGHDVEALDAFEQAHSFSVPGTDFELQPLALIAGTHALRGELDRARAVVDRIRAGVWRDEAINGYRGAFLHLAEALIAVDDQDFRGARERIDVMAPHLDTLEHWPLFAHVLALCDLGLGTPGHSDAALRRELLGRRRASITTLTGALLTATRANLLLAGGHATEARALLDAAPAVTATRVAAARVALLAADPERAIAKLAALDLDRIAPRWSAEAQLLTAAAALRLGRTDAARAAAEGAVATLAAFGLRHPLTLLPRSDRLALGAIVSDVSRELLEDAAAVDPFPRQVRVISLTPRERAVLERLAAGGTLSEIAEGLHVSPNTLKTQLRSVYRKLGVSDRESALATARGHGLIGS